MLSLLCGGQWVLLCFLCHVIFCPLLWSLFHRVMGVANKADELKVRSQRECNKVLPVHVKRNKSAESVAKLGATNNFWNSTHKLDHYLFCGRLLLMPDLCHCRCVLSFTKVFVCGESTERSFQPLQTDRKSKTAHLSAHALPSLDHNFPINRYTARSASALATYTAFVIHISSVTAMLKF